MAYNIFVQEMCNRREKEYTYARKRVNENLADPMKWEVRKGKVKFEEYHPLRGSLIKLLVMLQ